MRVAIVADQMPPEGNGGVASAHFNLIRSFEAAGLTVAAFTFADLRPDPAVPGIVRRRFPAWVLSAAHQVFLGLLNLRELLGRRHSKTGRAWEFVYSLCGSLNGLRLLTSILRFKPDLVVVPDRGAVAAFWPKSLKKKCVVIAHSNPLRFLNQAMIGRYNEADARLAFWFEQRMVRHSRAVVCPSNYMAEVFRSSYRFDGPVTVIPNLIDDGLVAATAARPFHRSQKPGSLAVSIPAASNPNKGRQFTFEIIRRLAASRRGEVFFFLSGEIDDEVAECLRHVPSNARVVAPGPLPYETNLAHLKSCQLCVSPTMIESFGMALLEAQVCGIPVVSFDVGGTGDVVSDGVTGRLVPFLDVEALVGAAVEILSKPVLRKKMARAARAHAVRLFSSELVTRRYMAFFRSLG